MRVCLLLTLVPLVACTASMPASPRMDGTPATEDASPLGSDGGADALPPPKGNTWTYLYANYFAGTSKSQTPGHCGRCHLNVFHGFRCGSDAHACYAGMVAVGLIDTSDPGRSRIGRSDSPLVWINPTSGVMPLDDAMPNPQAAADILAWIAAGAAEDVDAEAPVDAANDAPIADAAGD